MRALYTSTPKCRSWTNLFSALDYEMTLFMREQLQKVFMETRTTTLLVSHDLEEAVHLADKILLLTRKPTRIADTIPFDAPRPRDTATLSIRRNSCASRRTAWKYSSARCVSHEADHG